MAGSFFSFGFNDVLNLCWAPREKNQDKLSVKIAYPCKDYSWRSLFASIMHLQQEANKTKNQTYSLLQVSFFFLRVS